MTPDLFQNVRTGQLQGSPTMAISLAARRLQAAGHEVIDLSLGEPEFPTPSHISDAALKAARDGLSRYTGPHGTPELRDAIIQKFRRDNQISYGDREVTVAAGAKQIIFNALLATLEPGDEVIIPAPYWVSYSDMTTLHGGVACIIPCGADSNFKLTAEKLLAAITEKTRWLILNSPSNPSGAVYQRQEFKALEAVLLRHPRVLIMSDEIYEHITFDDANFVSFAAACPALRSRTLLVNGVSKAYAMTGWRLGYAAGPEKLIAGIGKILSQSTTCPSTISQAAAVAALNGPQEFVRVASAEYAERRALVSKGVESIVGLKSEAPKGAFYIFPECSSYIGARTPDCTIIETDTDLAAYLLHDAHVATVPGVAFGSSPHLRLSFAAPCEVIESAVVRIERSLSLLRLALDEK